MVYVFLISLTLFFDGSKTNAFILAGVTPLPKTSTFSNTGLTTSSDSLAKVSCAFL